MKEQPLKTDCTGQQFLFQVPSRRKVVAAFDGGAITSDGGVMLLRQVDDLMSTISRFARCFDDARAPGAVEHTAEELLRQRIFAIALGYEDLNDHEDLCRDPLLAVAVGKDDPTGRHRKRQRDQGRALASKSTLNRLEWGPVGEQGDNRYHRISVDAEAIDRFFVDHFLRSHDEPPDEIILDIDATDDPIHGRQEGRFFHGYYGCYCYLPLYIFCGTHLLCARLRRSSIDAAAGSVEELSRIVAQIRASWPDVRIVIRGDSGFARESLMAWCEENDVHFVLGLARNPRLEAALDETFDAVYDLCGDTGEPERLYHEWMHSTLNGWAQERRVIGKAEVTPRGENPRFVVTSLSKKQVDAQTVYESIYCQRGDMENRIKEQQLDLFADRTSAQLMRVNQIRLWFSSVAYILMNDLRRLGLAGTPHAGMRPFSLRLKLLKIGARIRVTVRKVWIHMATGYPHERLFAQVYAQLQRAGPKIA